LTSNLIFGFVANYELLLLFLEKEDRNILIVFSQLMKFAKLPKQSASTTSFWRYFQYIYDI